MNLSWSILISVRVKGTTVHFLSDSNVLNIVTVWIWLRSLKWRGWLVQVKMKLFFRHFLSVHGMALIETHNWHRPILLRWLNSILFILIYRYRYSFIRSLRHVNRLPRLRCLWRFYGNSCLDRTLIHLSPSFSLSVNHMFHVRLCWGGQLSWSHHVYVLTRLLIKLLSWWWHLTRWWLAVLSFLDFSRGLLLDLGSTSESTGKLFIISPSNLLLIEELISKCSLPVESMDISIPRNVVNSCFGGIGLPLIWLSSHHFVIFISFLAVGTLVLFLRDLIFFLHFLFIRFINVFN